MSRDAPDGLEIAPESRAIQKGNASGLLLINALVSGEYAAPDAERSAGQLSASPGSLNEKSLLHKLNAA
jgi:hypothetical protein